mgnify:CR=1 FL=1
MKIRVENFKYETGTFPLVEIDMKKVHLQDNGEEVGAITEHTVSAVKMVEGVEVVKLLNKYNHPFTYQGGNPFEEAFTALNEHISQNEN